MRGLSLERASLNQLWIVYVLDAYQSRPGIVSLTPIRDGFAFMEPLTFRYTRLVRTRR